MISFRAISVRDITRGGLNHWPVAQTELAHAFGNDIDQDLLVRDKLSGFLEKLSRHMAQGI